MSSAEPPPPVVDPDLQNLTFDQLARLVEGASPDSVYELARAFDLATARFEQVQDDIEGQTRHLWQVWSGRVAESFEDAIRRVSGLTDAVVQAMADPGYGSLLRRAGDALVQAQQRVRDLRAQNRQNDVEAVRQILYDLGTAYRDIGAAMSPMPDAVAGLPADAGGRNTPVPVRRRGEQVSTTLAPHSPRAGSEAGGQAAGGGAIVPFPAFTTLDAWHSRAGSAASAAAPIQSDDCASPLVLGRGGPVQLPSGGGPGEPYAPETGAVLGRPQPKKRADRQAPAKPKQEAVERPATVADAGDELADQHQQHHQPHADTAGKVTTSAAPAHHGTSEAPAAAKVTEPAVFSASAPAPSGPDVGTVSHQHAVVAAGPSAGAQTPPGQSVTLTSGSTHVAPEAAGAPTSSSAHDHSLTASATSGPVGGHPGAGASAGTPASAGEVRTPHLGPVARGQAALPAAPAFQAVTGALDVPAAGAPAGAGAPGQVPGPADHHPVSGALMGGMLRPGGRPDEQDKVRAPAQFLQGETGAWSSGADGAIVLGRGDKPLPGPTEGGLPSAEELAKITDPETLRLMLGRLNRRVGEGE